MKFLLTLSIFISGLFPVASFSMTMTAIELEKKCKVGLDMAQGKVPDRDILNASADAMECLGYVNGYSEGVSVVTYRIASKFESSTDVEKTIKNANSLAGWCEPNGVSPEQQVRVFLKYLERNPDKLNLHAPIVLAMSFANAWPCAK